MLIIWEFIIPASAGPSDELKTSVAEGQECNIARTQYFFASSSVGGLSGAFIPVSEDLNLSEAVKKGYLGLEKLEAMTAVCSVGLDMIAIPGRVDSDTISAILADEMAIGMMNHKTTAVRVIPVPGKDVGEKAVFGGLFGEAYILEVKNVNRSSGFIRFGGRIPAPITSLSN